MSSVSTPISAARFAAALPDLPLSSLHAKGAEIRNSIAHLKASNEQLRSFANEGDRECKDAILENEEVVGRMEERLELLKAEVEKRGYKWDEGFTVKDEDLEMHDGDRDEDGDGEVQGNVNGAHTTEANGTGVGLARPGLGDEELERRLLERLNAGNEDDDEDGVHL